MRDRLIDLLDKYGDDISLCDRCGKLLQPFGFKKKGGGKV